MRNCFARWSTSFIVVLILALAQEELRASLIVYESFDSYTSGSNLNGGAGGTGWTNTWTAPTGTDGATITTPANYVNGSVVVNGGTNALALGNGSSSVSSRGFATQTGTLYFSFLYTPVVGLTTGDFFQFMMNNDITTNNSGSIGDLNTGANLLGVRSGGTNGGTTVDSTFSTVQGTTYFLVGKFSKTSGGNYNRIDLFINPSSDIEPGSADAFSTGDSGITSVAFFTMRSSGMTLGDFYNFDELRVGTTFADVVPVPEPGTWSLIFVSVGLITWFVRR